MIVEMAVAHRVLRSIGCTISIWDGDVDEHGARDHLIRLAQDAEWPPGPLHLTDLRTIRRASVPDTQFLALLYEGTRLVEDVKVAVVVDPNQIEDTRLRFTAETTDLYAATFTTITEACAHLGVDAARIETALNELRHELEGPATVVSSSPR